MSAELRAFSGRLVGHPRLLSVQGQLDAAIAAPGDGDLVLVPGPTGVGKTTLFGRSLARLALAYPDPPAGTRPVISLLTPSYSLRGFAIKELFYAIMDELQEPGVYLKVAYPPAGQDVPTTTRLRRDPEWIARGACVTAIKRRGVRVILLDEAQHLCKAGGAAHVEAVLESIKFVILATGVRIVLAGTDDLKYLVDLNGQLARRAEIIHFGRYRLDLTSDIDDFRSVLETFQGWLPGVTFSLTEGWQDLYAWSLGRVGSLKDLLLRGLAKAEAGNRELTLNDLRPNATGLRSLETQRREIEAGEERFSADLGADEDRVGARVNATPRRRKGVPFTRNAERDPVGDPWLGTG